MSRYEAESGLTISAVAARTGVTVPTLRSWEQRYGFPDPDRLGGGHRRYTDDDVARIGRVVEQRRAGRTLAVAIELARRDPAEETDDATIYAGLTRHHPDLPAQVIGRSTMLALSHAIEDECLARAEPVALTAAFQTTEAYDLARPRWRLLAAEATSALVFAGFARTRTRQTVHEVSIPGDAALRREWSVVCDGPRSAAVLAGWERPDGRFEAFWSVEPDVVRLASRVGRSLAARFAPRTHLPPLPDLDHDHEQALRRATAITNRMVAYLDRY